MLVKTSSKTPRYHDLRLRGWIAVDRLQIRGPPQPAAAGDADDGPTAGGGSCGTEVWLAVADHGHLSRELILVDTLWLRYKKHQKAMENRHVSEVNQGAKWYEMAIFNSYVKLPGSR